MLKGAIVGFGEVARHGHWPAYARNAGRADRRRRRPHAGAARARGDARRRRIATFATLDELAARDADRLRRHLHAAGASRGADARGDRPRLARALREAVLLDPAALDVVRERAAGARGVAVVPVHNWKYAPIMQRGDGRASRPGRSARSRRVEIETSRLQAAPTAEPAAPNWRRDPAIAGGGILMDHGWHAVYLALHWFGQRRRRRQASLHRPRRTAASRTKRGDDRVSGRRGGDRADVERRPCAATRCA